MIDIGDSTNVPCADCCRRQPLAGELYCWECAQKRHGEAFAESHEWGYWAVRNLRTEPTRIDRDVEDAYWREQFPIQTAHEKGYLEGAKAENKRCMELAENWEHPADLGIRPSNSRYLGPCGFWRKAFAAELRRTWLIEKGGK